MMTWSMRERYKGEPYLELDAPRDINVIQMDLAMLGNQPTCNSSKQNERKINKYIGCATRSVRFA